MARQNLITNPSFEASATAGWTVTVGDRGLQREQSPYAPQAGTWYAFVNRSTAGVIQLTSAAQPVTVGAQYTASMSVNRDGTGRIDCTLLWYNASGSQLTPTVNTTTPANGAWTRLSVTGTAPTGAASAALLINFFDQAANFYVRLDAAMLEPGGTLNTYADGNTAGWQWDGTANLSTSRPVPNPDVSSLVSDFSSIPSFFNQNTSGVAITADSRGSVPSPVNANEAFVTNSYYNFTGSSVSVQVVSAVGATTGFNGVYLVNLANDAFYMRLYNGAFTGRITRSGVNSDTTLGTYSPTAHAFWRMRESGGTLYWEAGPDGTTWTVLGQAVHNVDTSGMGLQLFSGYGTGQSAPSLYDNLNMVPPAAISWAGVFTAVSSTAAGFQDADYNRDDGTGNYGSIPWPVPITAAPDGIRSLAVMLPSGGKRDEVLPGHRDLVAGDNVWFGSSFYLPVGFDTAARAGGDYQVIEQIRQYSDDGSPVAALEVRKGSLLLTGGYNAINNTSGSTYAYEQVLIPAVATGVRYYVAYRIGPFSTIAGASTIDVYVNGQAVLLGFTIPPPTLIGGSTSHKQGWYRDPGNTYAGTLYIADSKVGPTRASVESTPAPVDYTQAAADSAGVADTASSAAISARSPSDTAGVTDSVATAQGHARAVADTAAVGDDADQVYLGSQSPTDAVEVSDQTSWVVDYGRPITETVDTLEGGLYQQAPQVRDLDDEAYVVDDTATVQAWDIELDPDTVEVADETAYTSGGAEFLTDTTDADDDVSFEADYAPELTDPAGVLDSLEALAGYERDPDDDTLDVADSVHAVRTEYAQPDDDTLGVTDATEAVLVRAAHPDDAIEVTDGLTVELPAFRDLGDGFEVVDYVTVDIVGRVTTPITPVLETDTAFDLTPSATMPVPPAVESDVALGGNTQALRNAPGTSETDSTWTPRPTGSYPTAEVAEFDLVFPPIVLVDDGEFGVAITDADRVPEYRLMADWNRNGLYDHALSDLTSMVTDVKVERVLTGTLPAEIGLVEGYASAQLTVTLEGHWEGDPEALMDIVDVFGPYRSDSPVYGLPLLRTPIYLDTGFVATDGPRFDRRFTGTVSQINPVSADRTVQLQGLDGATQLRNTVTVSGAGLYAQTLAIHGPNQYISRFNSQWLIDRALRANGIYTSPPFRSDAVLAVTCHGSMIPEVGWGGAPQEFWTVTIDDGIWTTSNFGGALAPKVGCNGRWWLTQQVTAASGDGFGFSCWLRMYSANIMSGKPANLRQYFEMDLSTNATCFFRFGIDTSGRPYATLFYKTSTGDAGTSYTATATGYAPPSTAQQFAWQFVGVHVVFAASSMTVRFRINGTTYTATVTIPSRANNWAPGLYIYYNWWGPVSNFQLWHSATVPAVPWQGEDPNFVPQADLDPGNNELTGVPELNKVNTWDLIRAVTDAEGSMFYYTEAGRPTFRSIKGDQWYGRTRTVKETITADRNLADLHATTDESTVNNIINIKTKPQLITPWQDYYVSPDVNAFNVPASTTSYFDVQLPGSAYEIPPPLSTAGARNDVAGGAANYWNAAGGTGFVYFTDRDAWSSTVSQDQYRPFIRCMITQVGVPGQSVNQGVQIRVVRTDPWTMQVIINNQNTYAVRFATTADWTTDTNGNSYYTDDGEPALIIPAQIVEQQPEQVETYTDWGSVATYGPASYDVGGDDDRWRQWPTGFEPLADNVLTNTASPVPVLDAVDVPHDPRRRIGDLIILADPQGLGQVTVSIVGLLSQFSSEGATDQITVRPTAAPTASSHLARSLMAAAAEPEAVICSDCGQCVWTMNPDDLSGHSCPGPPPGDASSATPLTVEAVEDAPVPPPANSGTTLSRPAMPPSMAGTASSELLALKSVSPPPPQAPPSSDPE